MRGIVPQQKSARRPSGLSHSRTVSAVWRSWPRVPLGAFFAVI
jgi:hypothetical protein